MKILSEAESRTFYRVLTDSIDPRDTFLQLLFETGARVSESLTLGEDDLVGASLTIRPLKNSNPRVVTLSSGLVAKLRRLPPGRWSRSLAETVRLDSVRRSLTRHFHQRTKTLLGRRLNLHSLRHTAFSRLYVASKDLLLVKQWAGHKSINSTLVYLRVNNQEEANRTAQDILKSFGT